MLAHMNLSILWICLTPKAIYFVCHQFTSTNSQAYPDYTHYTDYSYYSHSPIFTYPLSKSRAMMKC